VAYGVLQVAQAGVGVLTNWFSVAKAQQARTSARYIRAPVPVANKRGSQ
jgi:hypothetical protein